MSIFRFIDISLHSLQAVRAYRLRTFFCILSVALGISAICIITASTEGAYKKALEIVDRFGHDSLMVHSGSAEARALGQRNKTITLQDIEAVRDAFASAWLITPSSSLGSVTVSYKDKKIQTRLFGSTSDYSRAWTWPVASGSDFSEEDVVGWRNVGLIGSYLAEQLFAGQDPIGKYVIVKGIPIQIVGVLSERGMSGSGANLDDRLVIPITTLMRKFEKEDKYVGSFRIRFSDKENLDKHIESLRAFLRQLHQIRDGEPDDFTIVSPKEIVKFLVALTGSLVLFLGVTGVLSLTVAGFVLANLFLLSVKERTREIGIRRASGAKRRDILVQFLLEAVFITMLGGLLGFVLGLVAGQVLTMFAEFPIYFSWKAFAIGITLATFVGLIFGLQPALKASNLHPIEAIKGA